jgi:hypothetical protein
MRFQSFFMLITDQPLDLGEPFTSPRLELTP